MTYLAASRTARMAQKSRIFGKSAPTDRLDSQLEELRHAGCRKIYREKVTGVRADRRQQGACRHPRDDACPAYVE